MLFSDEASFYRQPTQAWLWAWMGRAQPRLPYSHRRNTKMRVVGLLDAATGGVDAWDYPRATARRLQECWLRAAQRYPKATTIYLVLDNWPVHRHPDALAACAKDPRLTPVWLPTYAPWLNAIEKLWRWVRQHVTHTHPWSDDFRLYREVVMAEFHRLAPGSPELRRYCGLEQVFS